MQNVHSILLTFLIIIIGFSNSSGNNLIIENTIMREIIINKLMLNIFEAECMLETNYVAFDIVQRIITVEWEVKLFMRIRMPLGIYEKKNYEHFLKKIVDFKANGNVHLTSVIFYKYRTFWFQFYSMTVLSKITTIHILAILSIDSVNYQIFVP